MLHAVRHLNAQQRHAALDDVGNGLAQQLAEATYLLVLLLENAAVVIELVVFLGQVIDIVGDERGAVVAAGIGIG